MPVLRILRLPRFRGDMRCQGGMQGDPVRL